MKKKPFIFLIIFGILYAAVFMTIMLGTIFLPSFTYDNQKLLAANMGSVNKMNYRLSRHGDLTTITCGKMQGMEIIWRCNADEDRELVMYYNFTVTSGKAKLVLVRPDDTVITLVEQDSAAAGDVPTEDTGITAPSDDTTSTVDPMATLELKKGKNYMKIVCDKGTSFSLSFRMAEE